MRISWCKLLGMTNITNDKTCLPMEDTSIQSRGLEGCSVSAVVEWELKELCLAGCCRCLPTKRKSVHCHTLEFHFQPMQSAGQRSWKELCPCSHWALKEVGKSYTPEHRRLQRWDPLSRGSSPIGVKVHSTDPHVLSVSGECGESRRCFSVRIKTEIASPALASQAWGQVTHCQPEHFFP